jgi:hypothetical protein
MATLPQSGIRYEEASLGEMVYRPGESEAKRSGDKGGGLADDLYEEWVIGEERPWWYFRL